MRKQRELREALEAERRERIALQIREAETMRDVTGLLRQLADELHALAGRVEAIERRDRRAGG